MLNRLIKQGFAYDEIFVLSITRIAMVSKKLKILKYNILSLVLDIINVGFVKGFTLVLFQFFVYQG